MSKAPSFGWSEVRPEKTRCSTVYLNMLRPTRFTLRLVVCITVCSVLFPHGNCDEDEIHSAGVQQQSHNFDQHLQLRDTHIAALEERISGLERILSCHRSDVACHGVQAQEDHVRSENNIMQYTVAQAPGHERKADEGRRMLQGSSNREEDGISEGDAGRELVRRSALQRNAGRRAPKTNEERLSALEGALIVDGINVTSLADKLAKVMAALNLSNDSMLNSGDTAWVISCSSLVLLMTVPGLALFYGGLVRVQNVLSTVMQSFSIACLITVEWIIVGMSIYPSIYICYICIYVIYIYSVHVYIHVCVYK